MPHGSSSLATSEAFHDACAPHPHSLSCPNVHISYKAYFRHRPSAPFCNVCMPCQHASVSCHPHCWQMMASDSHSFGRHGDVHTMDPCNHLIRCQTRHCTSDCAVFCCCSCAAMALSWSSRQWPHEMDATTCDCMHVSFSCWQVWWMVHGVYSRDCHRCIHRPRLLQNRILPIIHG
jgi:hypothetical protein